MLQFFRKYQKYFFIVITTVVVITFVFFGTYQSIAPAFQTAGEQKSYAAQMADFLNSENWMVGRKAFGGNFLNDGVISREFLETGMGDLLVAHHADQFKEAFAPTEREKNYKPYCHAISSSLSAESVWSLFAPELPAKLKGFLAGKGDFKERKELFLAQRDFPPQLLAQFIRYQEQSNPQGGSDPRLYREDLSLFGHQTFSDWFGESFVQAIAEQIIALAQMAKQKGYHVSKQEVLTELIAMSQEVYEGLKGRVEMPIKDGQDLFQFHIRQQGLSEESVIKIWEDITLFRRLMHAVGDGALIDALALSEFYAFAHENATVELYQMAPEWRFQTMDALKEFELYLTLVGEKCASGDLPHEYAPLQTIETRAPELIGRRYLLSYASTSKKALQAKVSVKDTVQWECEPTHWTSLKKQFPELAQKEGTPFEILEKVDPKMRKVIDNYARSQIVEAHPEWMNEVLKEAKVEKKELILTSGIKKPFEGITDCKALEKALSNRDEIMGFTQDGTHYYRFIVQERGEKEVLNFKTAQKEGILSHLLKTHDVEDRIEALKGHCPLSFQNHLPAYAFASFIAKFSTKEPTGALAKQFVIEKKIKTLTRSEPIFIPLDEVLRLEKGALSTLKLDPKEGPYLYRFLERKQDVTLPMEKIKQSQALLSQEARRLYFEQCLKKSSP